MKFSMRMPVVLASFGVACVLTACRPDQPTASLSTVGGVADPVDERHGNPSITLSYAGGLPRPGAPEVAQSHPMMLVRVTVFPDGFAICESASGAKTEHQVPAAQVETLVRDLFAEGISRFGFAFAPDSSAYIVRVRGDRVVDAAWSAGWVESDFVSDDQRVHSARRWQCRIIDLACPTR